MSDAAIRRQIREARGKFTAMAVSYSLGVFNDNFFKQAAMLLAVGVGLVDLQGHMLLLFTAPYLLFSAPCGWLADRFPKRNIVIAAKALEVAAMICGAVGVVTGSWPLILAMVSTMGLQSAIFGPSLNGSIPELYPASYVTTANGILKVFVTMAILLGVAMAGILLDAGGRAAVAGGALIVAALGFLASFGVPRRPGATRSARFPWTGPVDSVRELLRIRVDRLLATVIGADMFIWFVGSLLIPIVNVLGKRQLALSDSATSGLLVAELSGIAVGGLLSARLARGRRWYRVLVPATLALAVMLGCVSLAAALATTGRYWLVLAALAGAGVAGGLFMIPCESFIQVRPAADRKGAVIAASNFVIFIGIALSGPIANALNALMQPSSSFAVVAGFALAVAVLLAAVLSRGQEP
jgi:MFS family permease